MALACDLIVAAQDATFGQTGVCIARNAPLSIAAVKRAVGDRTAYGDQDAFRQQEPPAALVQRHYAWLGRSSPWRRAYMGLDQEKQPQLMTT